MTNLLILKTGALGDVLRTTSILPGLHSRYPDARVTWLTAHGARDLVAHHPLVAETVTCDPGSAEDVAARAEELAARAWDRVLSLDDEEALCRAASRVAAGATEGALSGAFADEGGARRYTPDVAPWFDMGLLSVHGKERADELKLENQRSHPELLAGMLGIEKGAPELPLPDSALGFAEGFALRTSLHVQGPAVGLNTGAGGRWESKRLPVERVAEVVEALHAERRGKISFLLLGGPDEAERNAAILAAIGDRRRGPRVIDAGTGNALLDFAALVDSLDLLLTSDSLALHVAVARRIPVVAFFAPTSAAEIDLYGRGEKVVSTSPDYCSYRPDADTSTLTTDRVVAACLRQLPR